MFLVGIPLLLFPFIIYNMIVFLLPGLSLSADVWHFRMASGAEWSLTGGDLVVAGSIFVLLFEMMKAARIGRRTFVDHLLSSVLFIVILVEFLMTRAGASSTFFLLLVISFVDVVGGFAIGMRAAARNVAVTEADHVHQI
jgi:hypothetical protein